jgi:hypothetical protein
MGTRIYTDERGLEPKQTDGSKILSMKIRVTPYPRIWFLTYFEYPPDLNSPAVLVGKEVKNICMGHGFTRMNAD